MKNHFLHSVPAFVENGKIAACQVGLFLLGALFLL